MATANTAARNRSFVLLLLIGGVHFADCWDNEDLEIFDLVEEVNENFYKVIGVEQSSTTAEIKKAFRKLTLRFHPDKNDEENAEERFRKMAAVYEVLKDEKKREKYDKVLVEGLPDWRQPVFYFRRARKMSMFELTIVLSLIITIGQYCVFWGSYIEKLLVQEDTSFKKKKKSKKSKSAVVDENDFDEDTSMPLPKILDLWPFQLSVFLFYSVYSLPTTLRDWKEEKEKRMREEEWQQILEEERLKQEEEYQKEMARKPKKKVKPELPEYSQEMYSKFSMPQNDQMSCNGGGLANELAKVTQIQDRFGEEWTDDELVLLAKAVKKYPGGSADRWEHIAEMVGRSVLEVTNKSKETKGGTFVQTVNPLVKGSASLHKSQPKISDEIITHNFEAENENFVDDDYYSNGKVKKRRKDTKKSNPEKVLISQSSESLSLATACGNSENQKKEPIANGSSSDVGTSVEVKGSGAVAWSQNQQKILEWALKQYPKGTDRRWDLIAEHIPGKTKEECIARFKVLAELISQKKKSENASKLS